MTSYIETLQQEKKSFLVHVLLPVSASAFVLSLQATCSSDGFVKGEAKGLLEDFHQILFVGDQYNLQIEVSKPESDICFNVKATLMEAISLDEGFSLSFSQLSES